MPLCSIDPLRRLLADGDVVDLGDRSFEVLHLPGHSPGSIGLWEEATGVLFSGDAVYDGPLLDELDDSDVEAYVATMRRLRELPVTVVHAGHEPSFGRQRLVELCDDYLSRRAR
jgi:glyoxylase-like metal-dependent hydrolase (beta-lactamase superfamily II)